MIDLLRVTPKEWLTGYVKACSMSESAIRTAYIRRLIATAPDGACRKNAKELLE